MRRAALVSLLAVATVSAACASASGTPVAGQASGSSDADAPAPSSVSAELTLDEVVRAAAEATIDLGSARIDTEVRIKGSTAIDTGVGFTANGATSFGEQRQMAFTMDLSAFEIGNFSLIVDGSVIYLSGQVVSGFVEPGEWLVVDTTSQNPAALPFLSLTEGQSDASLALYYLYGGTGNGRELQPFPIRRREMTRIGLDVDLGRASNAVPESIRDVFLDNVAEFRADRIEREFEAEAWIGKDDGLIYRIEYLIDLPRSSGGGTMYVHYSLYDHGTPVDLGIPDEADQVRLEEAVP